MQTTNKRNVQILGGLLATVCLSTATFGQSADALIDKLVDKGVLTMEEAKTMREEADKDFRRAYSVKSGLPEWVTSLRFNGDVRLRYEGIYISDKQAAAASNAAYDRDRYRYRLRFGVTAGFWDNIETGFRLGSGDIDNASGLLSGSDPISSNQSFQNNGSKKGIFLDLVYAKWTAINNPNWSLKLTGGKMENPFVYSDMVFDRDYTPEGVAFQLTRNLSSKGSESQHALTLIGGAFVLDESRTLKNDPFYFGSQLRLESTWNHKFASSVGIAGFAINAEENLPSAAVPNINGGNTRNAAGGLRYSYNPIVADAAVTYSLESFPFYADRFPISLVGDYMYNPAAGSDNYGWSAGLTLGKSGKRGLWDLSYRYKYLGADAWFEEFVDSDFGAFYGVNPVGGAGAGYVSGTNVRGHIIKLQYSPFDSTTFAVTYFLTDLINNYQAAGAKDSSDVGRLQVDVSWKF